MTFSATETPQSVLRAVSEDIIRGAIRRGRKKRRTIYISKSANGRTTPAESLNPDTPEGRQKLEAYLTPIGRHYTISGLGAPEEDNAVSWRTINLSLGRRILVGALVGPLRQGQRARELQTGQGPGDARQAHARGRQGPDGPVGHRRV